MVVLRGIDTKNKQIIRLNAQLFLDMLCEPVQPWKWSVCFGCGFMI